MSKLKLACWSCGDSLDDEPLPLSRFAKCRGCGSDLRTCYMCTKFSPDHPGQCRDENSDYVEFKDQANFCTLFRPNPLAHSLDRAPSGDSALEDLQSLFGTQNGPQPEKTAKAHRREEAKKSLSELERLFSRDDDDGANS